MVQVIKPTLGLAIDLANNLRPMDLLELSATNPDKTPKEILELSIQISSYCYAIEEDGKCLGMFGVVPIGDSIGVPWMLSTDKFFELHTLKFMRQCKKYFKDMSWGFGYLANYIAVENTKCQQWLKWLGFTIHEGDVIYHENVPFYMFDKRIK